MDFLRECLWVWWMFLKRFSWEFFAGGLAFSFLSWAGLAWLCGGPREMTPIHFDLMFILLAPFSFGVVYPFVVWGYKEKCVGGALRIFILGVAMGYALLYLVGGYEERELPPPNFFIETLVYFWFSWGLGWLVGKVLVGVLRILGREFLVLSQGLRRERPFHPEVR